MIINLNDCESMEINTRIQLKAPMKSMPILVKSMVHLE